MRMRPIASSAVAVPNTAPVNTTPRGAPFGRTAATTNQPTTAPTGHASNGRSRRCSRKSIPITARSMPREHRWVTLGPLTGLVALAGLDLDVGAGLVVLGRHLVAVPVDLAGVLRRRVLAGPEAPVPGGSGAARITEHAVLERLRVEVRTGLLDAQGQHVHLVVDEVDDLGGLVARLDGLVGVVAVAGAQRLVRTQVADAEGVRPLVLVVELADKVDVGERRARHQPLRLVVLLLGLGGEEHG